MIAMNNNTERNPFDGWIGDEGEQGMTTLTQSGQLSSDKSIDKAESQRLLPNRQRCR